MSQSGGTFLQLSSGDVRLATDILGVRSVEDLDAFQGIASPEGPSGWMLGAGRRTPAFTVERRFGAWAGSGLSRASQAVTLIDAGGNDYALLVERVTTLPPADAEECGWLPLTTAGPAGRFHRAVIAGRQANLVVEPASLSSPKLAVPFSERRPQTAHATTNQSIRVLVAQGGSSDWWLGFTLNQVVEICAALPCMPVPGAPPWWRGIAVRGRSAFPVIDVGDLLGLGRSDPHESGRWAVVRFATGRIFAIPVGDEVSVISSPADLRPVTEDACRSDFLRFACSWAGGRLLFPALERL